VDAPDANLRENGIASCGYDTRGHGQSEVTPVHTRSSKLARDVSRSPIRLNIDKFHFCGLSMAA